MSIYISKSCGITLADTYCCCEEATADSSIGYLRETFHYVVLVKVKQR